MHPFLSIAQLVERRIVDFLNLLKRIKFLRSLVRFRLEREQLLATGTPLFSYNSVWLECTAVNRKVAGSNPAGRVPTTL